MPFLVEPDEENVKEKIKISERYLSLSFNGNFLILRVVESKKILAFHYKAVSRRPLENGKFDYSIERQKVIEIINKNNKTFAKCINIITNIPYKIKQSKTKNYMDYYIDHIYFSKQQKIIIQNDIKDYL